jgi:hypothetical protein
MVEEILGLVEVEGGGWRHLRNFSLRTAMLLNVSKISVTEYSSTYLQYLSNHSTVVFRLSGMISGYILPPTLQF